MDLDEILSLDIDGKSVLIIGCPASGKSWLSNKLNRSTHKLIHTDKYISQGYEMGMYGALNEAVCS